MKKTIFLLLAGYLPLFSLGMTESELQAQGVEDVVVLSATVQESPPQIHINFHAQSTNWFEIQRRSRIIGYAGTTNGTTENWTNTVATSVLGANGWTDTNVVPGMLYEYRVSKTNDLYVYYGATNLPTGYLLSGIRVDNSTNQYSVVLVMDNTLTTGLRYEIDRLRRDLAGDGWYAITVEVDRVEGWTSPSNVNQAVRHQIRQAYSNDKSRVKSVFLLGHVPVTRSGNQSLSYSPVPVDGHGSAGGAHAVDCYYADMSGTWDDTATVTNGWGVDGIKDIPDIQENFPGDGIYDEDVIPYDIKLGWGRVDVAELNHYRPESESDMLARYLDKNHAYRHAGWNLPRRCAMKDDMSFTEDSSYRNYPQFVGLSNFLVVADEEVGLTPYSSAITPIETDLSITNGSVPYTQRAGPFIFWNQAAGYPQNEEGWSPSFFRDMGSKAVFWTGLQSGYGYWGEPDANIRGLLPGKGYELAFFLWAGTPTYFIQHLGMGWTLGEGMRQTINNRPGLTYPGVYRYWQDTELNDTHERRVVTGLLGDPTLRLFPVIPVSNLTASYTGTTNVLLSWSASSDTNLVGYRVYRSADPFGPFTNQVTMSITNTTSLTDYNAPAGNKTYMVRAVKLEVTGSGSYLNGAQGVFVTLCATSTPVLAVSSTSTVLTGIVFQASGAAAKTVTVSNVGGGSLTGLAVAPNSDWLSASLAGNAVTLSVNTNANGRLAGVYRGSYILTADGADPLVVPLRLNVVNCDFVVKTEADAYVRSDTPTNNAGEDVILNLLSTRKNYVRFDVHDHVGKGDLVYARLAFALHTCTTGSSLIVKGCTNNAWSETGITWENQPSNAITHQIGSAIPVDTGTEDTMIVFDVTDYVRDQLTNQADKVTFVPERTTTKGTHYLATRENYPAPRLYLEFPTALVVNTNQLAVPEESTNSFQIKLPSQPAAAVTVQVVRMNGDTDLTAQTALLVFQTSEWDTWKTVTLAAGSDDDDNLAGTAAFGCTASGFGQVNVFATEVDNDSDPATRLPFSETFDGEGMATNLTVLNGQHSWAAGTNAVVQTGEFHGGAQALRIQNDTADHLLVFGSNRVAFSWWAKPAAGGAPAGSLLSGASAVVWVGTNGSVMAFSNTTAVTLPVKVASSVWNFFAVEADYGSNVWKLSVNGTNAAENLAFYSARSSNEAIRLIGGPAEAISYVDDIRVTNVVAAAQNAAFDNWLIAYYGTTNVNVNGLSSNGVNTILEAYVAGLNPTNPASVLLISDLRPLTSANVFRWQGVSGRVYNVYWSSNLVNGFQPFATNVPWTGNIYTDAVHGTENQGFYQIKVRLEE